MDFAFGVFNEFLDLGFPVMGVAIVVLPVFGDDFLDVAHELVGFFFASGLEEFVGFVLLLAGPALEFVSCVLVTVTIAFAVAIARFVALDTVVVAALAFLAITIIVGGEREADSGKEHGRQKKGPIFHVNVG